MGKKGMNDLISRSALLDAMSDTEFTTYFPLDEIYSVIDCAPAVDAEPVRHGRWMLNKHYGDNECSVCGEDNFRAWDFGGHTMNYCPNCGARMDAEVKE